MPSVYYVYAVLVSNFTLAKKKKFRKLFSYGSNIGETQILNLHHKFTSIFIIIVNSNHYKYLYNEYCILEEIRYKYYSKIIKFTNRPSILIAYYMRIRM